jgi:hypothetical protein
MPLNHHKSIEIAIKIHEITIKMAMAISPYPIPTHRQVWGEANHKNTEMGTLPF